MDPSSNFCNYRTALQGAAQRSQTANSNREKIVIPVFNLFIKDIYFLHKIHTNRLPNGQINFKVRLCIIETVMLVKHCTLQAFASFEPLAHYITNSFSVAVI